MVALVLLVLASDPVSAHTVAVGQSKIQQDGEAVRYELAVDYDELINRTGDGRPAVSRSDEAPDAALLGALRSR